MKRIGLSVIILGLFITSIAQVDKNAILEKLRSDLIPQTKDKNYNPYKYAKEKHIIACLEVNIENARRDECETLKEIIEMFYKTDFTISDKEKSDFIREISRFQCQESFDFLVEQIKNNPSETVRCYAMMYLSWSLNSDYLPCILEYAKKDSLSAQEKLAIAVSFMIFGVYTSRPELKEEAIKFLDEICYDSLLEEGVIFQNCIWAYYKLGGNSAVKFFNSWLEKQDGLRRISIAVFLAKLGEYEKTFPIFLEAIHSEITNNILEAIDGLKVIGTKEALFLIEEQTQNKNEKIAKYAQKTLINFEAERREK
jgi:hypothetical protein